MNFVFLMDPLETVIMEKDTSFILMLGAHRRRHKIYFVTDGDLVLKNSQLYFNALSVVPQLNKKNPFVLGKRSLLSDRDVDAVFVRSDPPFDSAYLMNTWLLDRLPKRVPVINSPAGLRTVNEKLWATQFTDFVPSTFIGRNREHQLSFITEQKHIIAKPTDGFGGQAVFQIKLGDSNTNVILETLTRGFTHDIILQKFIPEAAKGDKRILLLNGEILGAIMRVHPKNDFRNNLFAGGKAETATVNRRDEEIIAALKPKLRELGLYFVGIDILGGYLIEVNVTSPTCLQEMNGFYRQRLEERVISFVEGLVKK